MVIFWVHGEQHQTRRFGLKRLEVCMSSKHGMLPHVAVEELGQRGASARLEDIQARHQGTVT